MPSLTDGLKNALSSVVAGTGDVVSTLADVGMLKMLLLRYLGRQ